MRMVALGSSFASGPGIAPIVDRAAGRSGRNYAHLVAEALGAELVDATYSGSTTAHILTDARDRRHPPQVESVGPATDLVTVTSAGNDLGYLGTVTLTSLVRLLSRRVLTRPLARIPAARMPPAPPAAEQVRAAAESLTRVAEEVRRRAPRATVVLVDYLPIFGADAAVERFTAADATAFRATATALSGVFAEAAERSGALLLPASALTGHALGSPEPWVTDGSRLAAAYHPNADGMRAVAERLVDLVEARPGAHPADPAAV